MVHTTELPKQTVQKEQSILGIFSRGGAQEQQPPGQFTNTLLIAHQTHTQHTHKQDIRQPNCMNEKGVPCIPQVDQSNGLVFGLYVG